MVILLTGGAGYIGSHTCVELLQLGYEVVVLDNFSNSQPKSIQRVDKITGKSVKLVEGDIRNQALLESVILEHHCDVVIHFAGLKAVGESQERPLLYYDNNIVGTVCLLQAMKNTGVKKLIFSSSATVYGEPQFLPLTESHPLSAVNVYGRNKLMIEDMLRDLLQSDPSWSLCILRYFNPVGAHESGLIGENPQGIPNNLMPFIAQVAAQKRHYLNIWGNDYSTKDGTAVRDYIHVVDLALGHTKVLEHLFVGKCLTVNLGTGKGYSVLEMLKAFENVCGQALPYEFKARRSGDVAECYANADFALECLGWKAVHGIEQMCQSAWNWQTKNPEGY